VLSPLERAVLDVLSSAEGRVVSRTELTRKVGLVDGSPRRCEAALVGLRRTLGPDAIVNVRGRGWRLPVDHGA
jgi:DNA-binding response OmpR family regulator